MMKDRMSEVLGRSLMSIHEGVKRESRFIVMILRLSI